MAEEGANSVKNPNGDAKKVATDDSTKTTSASAHSNGSTTSSIAANGTPPAKKQSSVYKQQASTAAAAVNNVAQINREFHEKSILNRAHELGIPYVNIGKTPLNPDFLKILDFKEAKKARIIPFFKVGKKLRIAVEDPNKSETVASIKSLQDQGYQVSTNLASSSGIDDAFKIYEGTQKYKKIEIVKNVDEKSIQTYEKEIADLVQLPPKLEGITAEESLNLLNIAAMKTSTSDVHYEPSEGVVSVRFRIDGVLHEVFQLKPAIYEKISNQIKYEAKMRLNLSTVPQDGRYTFSYNKNKVAVRVSSIPTPFGESFVCRILPSGKRALTFEELGFQGVALKKIQNAVKISQGMILVTGPTGSGKTTTLYSLLNTMNLPDNKIITLEDPVEYQIAGVTQSQIDEKRDYSFSTGLRSILRHDPDIVMLGEIRDLETAETAAQASLTGHVLLSTLHTNSAIESIPRLINMGLPPFMVAPVLNTIIAQRLVRKICPHCSTMDNITDSERKEFEDISKNLKNIVPGSDFKTPDKVAKVHGCNKCSQTGYSGRLVLCEVITISSEIENLILNNASTVDLIKSARKEGILTMREDGFMKAAQGLTTLEEVHRVTNVSM